jgi:hypothetical protein
MNKSYYAFVLCRCKDGKVQYFTNSARKARNLLEPGLRIEVWNDMGKSESIRAGEKNKLNRYVTLEKEYIKEKQRKAEEKNRRRRGET